jgi:hypothetical protein
MTFAYWMSVIFAVFGIFFGLLFGLFSYANSGPQYGYYYVFLWIVCTPIVFAMIGLFASLTAAIIYNTFVRRRGGMFFEFEDDAPKVDLPPPPPIF